MQKKSLWMIVGTAVVVLGIGVILGFLAIESADDSNSANAVSNANTSNANAVLNVNWTTNGNENANESVANTNTSVTNTNTSEEPANNQALLFTPGDDLRVVSNPDILLPEVNSEMVTIDAGTLQSSKYQGQSLYLVKATPDGPYFYPVFFRFVNTSTGLVLLAKQSEDPAYILDPAKYTVDSETMISELDYPTTLTGPSPRQTLELDAYATGYFHSDGLTVAFTHPTYGAVYTDLASANSYPRYGFYLRAPDGTVRTYKLKIDFVNSSDVPAITWTDSTTNTTAYNFTKIGGCGSQNFTNVVDPNEVVLSRDLERIGQSSAGDPIYGLKDERHELLMGMYDSYGVLNDDGTKESYDVFIANRPIIFFLDSFDRLVQGQSNDYQPLAECGKPVIYLYPEKTTDVSVKVEPSGGFSKTEPAYNNGWNVTATPEGQLTELATGSVYPYLFWEGRSNSVYQTPNRGWVVPQSEVQGFLLEKLAKLGLNAKESADFIEFWEPRMQGAPYYFVTFLGNREMNQLAPLTVDPKPDTVIRILMDFTPLEKPIDVQGYDIRTPERQGFTVVEWGGVLR